MSTMPSLELTVTSLAPQDQQGLSLGVWPLGEIQRPLPTFDPQLVRMVQTVHGNRRLIVEQQQQSVRWGADISELRKNIVVLLGEMKEIKAAVDRCEARRNFVVPLTTLSPEQLTMKFHIPATIDGDGEDFTATFSEANVSASGETAADAIANLKESIVSTFEFLESLPTGERGPLPSRQWAILSNVLSR